SRQLRPRLEPPVHQAPRGQVERVLRPRIRELQPRDLAKAALRLRELGHAAPRASAVARWTMRTADPDRSARPLRCIRHPGSAVTRTAAAAAPAGLGSA